MPVGPRHMGSTDIEIPMELIDALPPDTQNPQFKLNQNHTKNKMGDPTSGTDILRIQHPPKMGENGSGSPDILRIPHTHKISSNSYLPALSPNNHGLLNVPIDTQNDSMNPITQMDILLRQSYDSNPYESQFLKYKGQNVPYSVLRGYVFGKQDGDPRTFNNSNKLPNRGRRHAKNKDLPPRSRSECHVRQDYEKLSKQLLSQVSENKENKSSALPHLPADFGLVHNASAECTCNRGKRNRSLSYQPSNARSNGRSTSNDGAAVGACQLRDRLRMAASRLGSQDMLISTERERVRNEIVHGLSARTDGALHGEKLNVNKKKDITSNDRASKFGSGSLKTAKSHPPKQRTSSRNFINTWLDAGATVPKFVQYKKREA